MLAIGKCNNKCTLLHKGLVFRCEWQSGLKVMVVFDLTMHDTAAGLPGLNRRLEALGAHYRGPTRGLGTLQVGLDECISNIIEHGYGATGGRCPVRVVVAVSGGAAGKASGAQAGTIFARSRIGDQASTPRG